MSKQLSTRTFRGAVIPAFFYGTAWKEDRTAALVAQALDLGFRAIDTANQRKHYFEAGVGEAIGEKLARAELSRSDLFVQTKFTYARGQDRRLPYDPALPVATQVEQSFESSLLHLGLTELDSLLLHGPESARGLTRSDREVWQAFERLHDAQRVRFLGVSNVSREQLAELCETSRVQPAFVQNRCYARSGWDREVRAFCREHDLVYQGFSLLTANARELQGRVIGRLAERARRSRAQIVFRFALDVGMIPLTGSSDAEHLRSDLDVFEFELDAEDIALLERVSAVD